MGNAASTKADGAAAGLSVAGKLTRRRDARKQPPQLDDGSEQAAISTVRGLLGALNLGVYAEAFVVAGCCDAESLAQLTPAGLARIQRKSRVPILPHHQALLLHASQQLRQALAAGDTAVAADQDAPVAARLQPWPSLGSPEDEADAAAAADAPADDAATASDLPRLAGAEASAAVQQQQHVPAAIDAAAAPAGEQPAVVETGPPGDELHTAGSKDAAPAAAPDKPAGAARTRLYRTATGAFGRLTSSRRKQQQGQRHAAPAAAAAGDHKPLWRIAGRSKSGAARTDTADSPPVVASPLTSGRAQRAATVAASAVRPDRATGSGQHWTSDAWVAAAPAGAGADSAAGPAKADVAAESAAAVPAMPPPPAAVRQPLPGLSEIEPADSMALDAAPCPWQQQADRSRAGSPASDAEAALGPPLQREECFCEGSESVYWSPGNPFLDEEAGCFGGGCFAGAGGDAAAAAAGGMMPELPSADGGLAAAAAAGGGSTAVQGGASSTAAAAKHTPGAAAATGPLMAHKPTAQSPAAVAVSGAAAAPGHRAACTLWNGLPGAVKRQAWGSTASLRTQPLPALADAAAAVARPARKKPLSAAAAAAAPGVLTSQAFHLQQLMRASDVSGSAVVAGASSIGHHQHQRRRHPGLDASQCNDSAAGALQQLARQQASNQAFIDRLLQQGHLAAHQQQPVQPVVLMGHLVPVSRVLHMSQPTQPGRQQQQQLVYRYAPSMAGSLAGGSAAGAGTAEVRSCLGAAGATSADVSHLAMRARSRAAARQQQQQHATSVPASASAPPAGAQQGWPELLIPEQPELARAGTQPVAAAAAAAAAGSHASGSAGGAFATAVRGGGRALSRMHEFEELVAVDKMVKARMLQLLHHASSVPGGGDAAAVQGAGATQAAAACAIPGAHDEEPAALAGGSSSRPGHQQPQVAAAATPAPGDGARSAAAPAPAAAAAGQASRVPAAAEAAVAQMRDSPMKQRVPCSDQQQKLCQGSGPQQQQQAHHASPSRQAKRRATRQLWEGTGQPCVDAATAASAPAAVQPVQTGSAGGPPDLLQEHIAAALGQAGGAAACAAAVKALSTAAASDQQHRCSGAVPAGGGGATAAAAAPDVLAKDARATEGAASNPRGAALPAAGR